MTLLTVLGGVMVAVLGTLSAQLHKANERSAELGRKVDRVRAENHALWRYTRGLIDHIYKGDGSPPPEPPASISHLYEYGDAE